MVFRATLMVQGAAVWAPNRGRKGIQVLWPSWQYATDHGVRDPEGSEALCKHESVVLYRARDQDGVSDGWRTLPIGGSTVRFASDSKVPITPLARVRGLPHLAKLLPSSMPNRNDELAFPEPALNGGLRLEQGRIEPDVEWEEEYGFRRFDSSPVPRERPRGFLASNLYSNVHRVMLGNVSYLHLESVGAEGAGEPLEFTPAGKQVEIWIRHFCSPRARPDTESCAAKRNGAWDGDFVLNYTLNESARTRIFEGRQNDFPLPLTSRSWISINPVGDCTKQCLGSKCQHAKRFLPDFGSGGQ